MADIQGSVFPVTSTSLLSLNSQSFLDCKLHWKLLKKVKVLCVSAEILLED